jgi:oxalate decarboxylase
MFPIIEDSPGGDTSFHNNVPKPILSQKTLPSFKFELEKTTGKQENESFGKEANAANFPISEDLAGVSMKLAPGIMRELHWHADAAEWAYVISGRMRTTLVNPAGHSETCDFGPGDIWYFPRGHGHQLQAIGNEDAHFILIFDNGHFSEFGTFSISDWMSQAPAETVARSLNISEDLVRNLPQGEVYFAKGAIPPEPAAAPLSGPNPTPMTHKFSMTSMEPTTVFDGGREWTIDSTRFPISRTMTGVVFELDAGGLRTLHWHPNASEWQYVLSGSYKVTLFGAKGRYREEILNPGDVGYIPQGYGHSIENVSGDTGRILLGLNSGIFQKIDLADWVAGQPADVLATNLSLNEDEVATLPRKDIFITGKPGKQS